MYTAYLDLDRELEVIKRVFDVFRLEIPSDYFCFDSETTGFNFAFNERKGLESECADDLITELGHCDVTDCSADIYESTVLDWTKLPEYIDVEWLKHKLKTITDIMTAKGSVYHVPYSVMKASGISPVDALQKYVTLLSNALNAGKFIVGQNILNFDVGVFADTTQEWLGKRFEIPGDRVIDVGVFEKARQLAEMPRKGETLVDYQRRIRSIKAAGVKWSSTHCCEVYGLNEKYGLDAVDMHSAGFDSMLCHLLLEEMRLLGDEI